MNIRKQDSLPLRSQEDVVAARQRARAWAVECGFNIVDQTKIVTATSELARNAVIYGGGGLMHMQSLEDTGTVGLRLSFSDDGPGIVDIQLALKDGYTSGSGLGLGLGGARRLMDEFEISSEPQKGTRVTITRWRR